MSMTPSLTFTQSLKSAICQNQCNFSGRARRSEYWYFTLFQTILFYIMQISAMDVEKYNTKSPFYFIFILTALCWIYSLIPSLSLSVRRLHDTGKSGCYMFLGFVPFGFLVLLMFFCQDSNPGSNIYGSSPKYISTNLTPIIPIVDQRNIIIQGNAYPQENVVYPQGNVVTQGNVVYPQGNVVTIGNVVFPQGNVVTQGNVVYPQGNVVYSQGNVDPQGNIVYPQGNIVLQGNDFNQTGNVFVHNPQNNIDYYNPQNNELPYQNNDTTYSNQNNNIVSPGNVDYTPQINYPYPQNNNV